MGTRIEPHGWQRRRAKQLKRRQGGERKRESIFSLTEKPNACFKAIPSRMAAPRERKRQRARERALHFRGKPNNSSKNGAAGERLLCHCRLFCSMLLRTRQRERRKLSRAIATSTPLTYVAHSKNRLYVHQTACIFYHNTHQMSSAPVTATLSPGLNGGSPLYGHVSHLSQRFSCVYTCVRAYVHASMRASTRSANLKASPR